jgi:hypothetical protein
MLAINQSSVTNYQNISYLLNAKVFVIYGWAIIIDTIFSAGNMT